MRSERREQSASYFRGLKSCRLLSLGGGRVCTARHQIASSAREAIVCIYSNHACSNGNIYLYTLYCAFQEVLMHL